MKKIMLAMVAVLLLVSCSNSSTPSTEGKENELQKITMVLDWTPNTNHTGLYVAQENGYFKENGLDVEIITPGESSADALVASGKADFGISYQENITQARTEGVPIVSIAAVIQHNTSGFASPVDKNIQSPKDFVGKTYGAFGSEVEKSVISSLMQIDGGDVNDVEFLNIGDTDFFTATKKDVDFAWIYYGWTGVEAELRGEKLNMIYLTDFSDKLDYYTPVIATNEKMIDSNPETVKTFLKAVSEGYEYSIENPNKASEILLSAAPDLDKELVKKSQEWLASKYQDDADRWGEQKLSVWENYANWMYDNKILDSKLDAEKAFTNEFLPEGDE
ncbi:ABC transporter substrate-binding protein [Bacillus sp. B1-b2]|uniref:ABC transporter substrate-binding protein n=1 Tax=Bacillus sp. B1-b2 TaxID=2653201 RepID=UPI001261DD15|nr:ABC transporter substrate-binding protein [Bacillus sp. B1-b2]KAB7669357.1 ABC transporter substrate-binding protein [Bacillus sp. B1-b2]